MATIKRIGFGQVEPNHLSAQRTGQIYAQLPANKDIKVLENGQFVKYDYANNEVNFTGKGEWMLVFNEVKLYDDAWRESYKDFAMKPDNRGEMYPRLFKTSIGDIFTTNTLEDGKNDISFLELCLWKYIEDDEEEICKTKVLNFLRDYYKYSIACSNEHKESIYNKVEETLHDTVSLRRVY